MRTLRGHLIIATLVGFMACSKEPAEEPDSSDQTITTRSGRASLETPLEAAAGSAFKVSWTGPDAKNDYVTIVEKEAPKGSYLSYAYTRKGSTLELTASDTPGDYEIRYVDEETKEVVVSAPISITEVDASLDVPGEVSAGSSFHVSWTGPDNKNDYVTIVEKGATQGTYGSYAYTRNGSPLVVTASETPGDHEVRYVMGQSKRILASQAITVEPVQASVGVPSEVMLDSQVEVTWTGPDNQNDYITIVEAGGAPGQLR